MQVSFWGIKRVIHWTYLVIRISDICFEDKVVDSWGQKSINLSFGNTLHLLYKRTELEPALNLDQCMLLHSKDLCDQWPTPDISLKVPVQLGHPVLCHESRTALQ